VLVLLCTLDDDRLSVNQVFHILPYCSGFENRNNSGPLSKKVKNLQMEADRLELIARHNFAPSNRPRLFARPMRIQIVLGARLYPAWFTHGRWPVSFRAAGLRGRRNRR
jgi:hypothetical protein